MGEQVEIRQLTENEVVALIYSIRHFRLMPVVVYAAWSGMVVPGLVMLLNLKSAEPTRKYYDLAEMLANWNVDMLPGEDDQDVRSLLLDMYEKYREEEKEWVE